MFKISVSYYFITAYASEKVGDDLFIRNCSNVLKMLALSRLHIKIHNQINVFT